MNKHLKVGLITFGVFTTEALIHYNLGARKDSSIKGFVLPPKNDFIKLAGVVAIFSFISVELSKEFGA